jgi:hypothetical protein
MAIDDIPVEISTSVTTGGVNDGVSPEKTLFVIIDGMYGSVPKEH